MATHSRIPGYRWRYRAQLVQFLRKTTQGILTSDMLEEKLTDMARYQLDAYNAIHRTTDAQWKRLLRDVNHGRKAST